MQLLSPLENGLLLDTKLLELPFIAFMNPTTAGSEILTSLGIIDTWIHPSHILFSEKAILDFLF